MNTTIKRILWPLVLMRRQYDNYLKSHNPEKLFSIYHKRTTGKYLNIDNPKSLNEKIAYMEFRTDTTLWTRLADKVAVRDYIKERGFEDNMTKLYGVWSKADDIDFDKLPNTFVIKTNNGSATNILVKDKSKEDTSKIRKQLDAWLKVDYGYHTAQPHYSRIKPLILAEEYLYDNETTGAGKMLIDYKFYCANGKPLYLQVMSDRKPNTHDIKLMVYDMNWNTYPEFVSGIHETINQCMAKPKSFEKMVEMVSVLSKPFPFVRVDLYEINGKPVFGEMTFTPGFDTASESFKEVLGKQVKLQKYKG